MITLIKVKVSIHIIQHIFLWAAIPYTIALILSTNRVEGSDFLKEKMWKPVKRVGLLEHVLLNFLFHTYVHSTYWIWRTEKYKDKVTSFDGNVNK